MIEKRLLRKTDVIVDLTNNVEGELGMFSYDMDWSNDLTVVTPFIYKNAEIDKNALLSSVWRINNIWRTGYYKNPYNVVVSRPTEFLILAPKKLSRDLLREVAREFRGNRTLKYES